MFIPHRKSNLIYILYVRLLYSMEGKEIVIVAFGGISENDANRFQAFRMLSQAKPQSQPKETKGDIRVTVKTFAERRKTKTLPSNRGEFVNLDVTSTIVPDSSTL